MNRSGILRPLRLAIISLAIWAFLFWIVATIIFSFSGNFDAMKDSSFALITVFEALLLSQFPFAGQAIFVGLFVICWEIQYNNKIAKFLTSKGILIWVALSTMIGYGLYQVIYAAAFVVAWGIAKMIHLKWPNL